MPEELEEIDEEEGRSGVERSAILLLTLGKEQAAKVLSHLNPREVQLIGNAMAMLSEVKHQEVTETLRAFLDELGEDALGVDPAEFAQTLMSEALGISIGRSFKFTASPSLT
jgi:flagellar motor switch protein FliG